MQVPLQLAFQGVAQSDALAGHVRRRAQKLQHLLDGILSCHVVVDPAGRQLEDWVTHRRMQRHDESADRRGR